MWECFSIIANPKIELRSSQVSFIVNTKVWDVLLDFSRGFSRYDLEVAFSLESPYAMRFYEMLSGQVSPVTYTLESLRSEFMLEGKYAQSSDFIKYVVESAKRELDAKSPVTFTYQSVKEGRRITRLVFFPVRRKDREQEDSLLKSVVRKYGAGAALSPEEFRFLREIGFTENGIRNNLPLFLDCKNRLDFIYELALIKGRAREKKNPCGWCIRTLRGKLSDLTAR